MFIHSFHSTYQFSMQPSANSYFCEKVHIAVLHALILHVVCASCTGWCAKKYYTGFAI